MPQTTCKPKHPPPLRLSLLYLSILHAYFSDNASDCASWIEVKPERKRKREAFVLPPVTRLVRPRHPISDQDREAMETAAWQGDLLALAELIRRDPRYIACPFTLAVAVVLRRQAEQTHSRWRGDPLVREDRDEARAGLKALAQAWMGLHQQGQPPEPPPSTVALLGHALTEVYTEARAQRAVRFSEALKVAKEKMYGLGSLVWVHPDQWGPWIEKDLRFVRDNPRRGDPEYRTVKTVVTDRLEVVFELSHGRVRTLRKKGLSELHRAFGTDSEKLPEAMSKFIDALRALGRSEATK